MSIMKRSLFYALLLVVGLGVVPGAIYALTQTETKANTTLPAPGISLNGWAHMECDASYVCNLHVNVPDGTKGGTVYFLKDAHVVGTKKYLIVVPNE